MEWNTISEEVSKAGVQGTGGETACSQSLEGGRKSVWGGKFGWEFLQNGLDFLSEEECSDTLLRVRVLCIGRGIRRE